MGQGGRLFKDKFLVPREPTLPKRYWKSPPQTTCLTGLCGIGRHQVTSGLATCLPLWGAEGKWGEWLARFGY